MTLAPFLTVGTQQATIDVRISYRIIQLFSEGLYKSPNKAVEELVSNAFDAGARNVHVVVSPDLRDEASTIVVLDDGEGMDADGLRQHWLIGVSNKRVDRGTAGGRKQIGKFGIGKLATYVLANRLTHVCKRGNAFFATSMDYTAIPAGEGGGLYTEELVQLPLNTLTEEEALTMLRPWLERKGEGFAALRLFGPGAATSWTVAIMSDLKDMATEIHLGRLRWVLRCAMPLRDDFRLFVNGEALLSRKLDGARVGSWVLGKDMEELPKPAPDGLQVTIDDSQPEDSPIYYGLTHPELGRVTGYAEVFEDLLTGGTSGQIERSHGFFIYVRGRLVNIDDEYFGIDSNLLRHGTFSRFRMVAHIDRLDDELRSSRETIRHGALLSTAQLILRSVFNYARTVLEKKIEAERPGAMMATRLSNTPTALARRPLLELVRIALEGKVSPRFVRCPTGLAGEQQLAFLDAFRAQWEQPEGLVKDVVLEDLAPDSGIALYDAGDRRLTINTLHPFVAYFLDEYSDRQRSLPLELLAMSEVLMEAQLYSLGMGDAVDEVLFRRDELLRYLARATGRRNAFAVARDLLDATTDKDALERELVAAFDSMGFSAIPLGGSGRADGRAEAHLPALSSGTAQTYAVSLEAKSKERPGARVTNQGVRVSTVARQRDDANCDHALVVGPDFATSLGDSAALVKEIVADHEQTTRTITLITAQDLARLVRLVPLKRINLKRLRELFQLCRTPEESRAWVERIANEEQPQPPYREILDIIAEEQREDPAAVVEYATISAVLRRTRSIQLPKTDVMNLCQALSRMAPGLIIATKKTVELNQRVDKVLQVVSAAVQLYPEEERRFWTLP